VYLEGSEVNDERLGGNPQLLKEDVLFILGQAGLNRIQNELKNVILGRIVHT
jgi:hypothetical protein